MIFNRVSCNEIELKKLEKWIKDRGFTLIKGKQKHIIDQVDVSKKIVHLSTRQNACHQLFSLAHECGHIITRTNKKKFNTEFPMLCKWEDKEDKKKPLRFYAEEVFEEQLAWKNGEKLAKQLNITLDTNEYHRYASKFVLQYMLLATENRKWLIR